MTGVRRIRYQVYMTYMYFSFFFIPLFKWNKRFYVKMSCCDAVYELTRRWKGAASRPAGRYKKFRPDVISSGGRRRGYYDSGTYKTWKMRKLRYETEEDFEYCFIPMQNLWRRRRTDRSWREFSIPCRYEAEPRIFKLLPSHNSSSIVYFKSAYGIWYLERCWMQWLAAIA